MPATDLNQSLEQDLHHSEPAGQDIRHDWTQPEIANLFDLPLHELLFFAHSTHRRYFDPSEIQLSQLLSIKTGGCSEDCAYCPQSARYNTGVDREQLMAVSEVISKAKTARNQGATRYCLGAGWRNPKDKDLDHVCDMVKGIKELGMEACVTLGMLEPHQAKKLKAAGLDYYNHNIDSSESYYKEVITTRTFDDRLNTLNHVREADINVCCGGIVGMGETRDDRAGMLMTLANLPKHPESVPINQLIPIPGTPLSDAPAVDPIEFVKMIAVTRMVLPKSVVRLSAGREEMSEEMQALCFFAGANSVFYGDTLLTAGNPQAEKDQALLAKLGLKASGRAIGNSDA
jgi:biotin synthase